MKQRLDSIKTKNPVIPMCHFSFPKGFCVGALTLAILGWSNQNAASAETGNETALPGFTNYVQKIPGGTVSFEMVAVPGGTITVGSSENAVGRTPNELPAQNVTIKPFWMGRYEISWQEFVPYVFADREEVEKDKVDGVTHPTKPYGSVYRDRGEKGYPALGMSQHTATEFCKWLSWKTGVKYRLPTEAEWEYACRAGADTAYFWGEDPAPAKEYAWFKDNSKDTTHPIGKLKPNKFGLYDICGNVAEWCAKDSPDAPSIVRGGGFPDPVQQLRCAARQVETPQWNELDPQSPQSIWWLSAADFVGIRVVRSLSDELAAQAEAKPAAATETAAKPADNAKAQATYKRFCAGCHGVDGKGQTALGKRYGARDYSSAAVKATLNDEAMTNAIKNGISKEGKHLMMAYKEKLSDDEIKALVAYMKAF
ncbi:MAG: SUMF1/EgtB/PvdO family nonheme iron enzyme [Candidatus Omnitrophica bacterium]|nr:SUMF1/EgtB/PvdO family nonheme iron enzyme [Candidatus Omnitrophota bacterium]